LLTHSTFLFLLKSKTCTTPSLLLHLSSLTQDFSVPPQPRLFLSLLPPSLPDPCPLRSEPKTPTQGLPIQHMVNLRRKERTSKCTSIAAPPELGSRFYPLPPPCRRGGGRPDLSDVWKGCKGRCTKR
jgi:hypothetical protein